MKVTLNEFVKCFTIDVTDAAIRIRHAGALEEFLLTELEGKLLRFASEEAIKVEFHRGRHYVRLQQTLSNTLKDILKRLESLPLDETSKDATLSFFYKLRGRFFIEPSSTVEALAQPAQIIP